MSKPFPCCCGCIHCPDYADDWSFIFCSLTHGTDATLVSGDEIADVLMNLGAFSLPITLISTSGNQKTYEATKTVDISADPTQYTGAEWNGTFDTLYITIRIVSECNSTGGRAAITVRVQGEGTVNGGFGGINFCYYESPLVFTAGCGDIPEQTTFPSFGAYSNQDVLTGGVFKGSTGVFSISC